MRASSIFQKKMESKLTSTATKQLNTNLNLSNPTTNSEMTASTISDSGVNISCSDNATSVGSSSIQPTRLPESSTNVVMPSTSPPPPTNLINTNTNNNNNNNTNNSKRDVLTQISTNLINVPSGGCSGGVNVNNAGSSSTVEHHVSGDLKIISNLNKFEIEMDENLRNTSKSIEAIVTSSMFNRLYELNRNLNAQQHIDTTDANNNNNNKQGGGEVEELSCGKPKCEDDDDLNDYDNRNVEFLDDDESDDSYAARFGDCVRKVRVYLSATYEPKAQHGGLFRFIILRNKSTQHVCVFLVKLKSQQPSDEPDSSLQKKNEFWFWWM
jgi:hypothetical protein